MPRRWSPTVLLLIPLLLATPAVCGTINIGLVSFDVVVPGGVGVPGVNVFNISNLTGDPLAGGFALPPDFPVLTGLTFLSSTLTMTVAGSPLVIPLGDLAPGPLGATESLQFPDTTSFFSAIFSATLSQTSFGLADSSTFTPENPLPASTVLTLTVSGVKDLAGNAVPISTTHFTTGTGPDTITPLVVSGGSGQRILRWPAPALRWSL